MNAPFKVGSAKVSAAKITPTQAGLQSPMRGKTTAKTVNAPTLRGAIPKVTKSAPEAEANIPPQPASPHPASPTPQPSALQKLLALEGEAMAAQDRLALKHIAVNRPRTLLELGHVIWVERHGPHVKLTAISSQAVFDKTTPFAQWMTRHLSSRAKKEHLDTGYIFDLNSRREDDDFDYPFIHAFYAPFAPNPRAGGLLFTRSTQFTENEIILLTRLGHVFGTSSAALGAKRRAKLSPKKRTILFSSLALCAVAAFIPVPMTELAPAEIVADDPFMITAPIDGVMDAISVPPNTEVEAGQSLGRLNDLSYRNEYALAVDDMQLADARLRQASLTAFIDETAKRDIAVAGAERALAEARKAYAHDRLGKTELIAPRGGLAIYSDPQDWAGRPVSTGEAIIQIADPTRVLLRIDAPLASGKALRSGARVRMFMDADPLHPLEATLERAAYYAEEQAGGKMAYTAYARLERAEDIPRIGTRGVAKIYGESAPLGFWLLRRPITALRQFIGF